MIIFDMLLFLTFKKNSYYTLKTKILGFLNVFLLTSRNIMQLTSTMKIAVQTGRV